MATLRWYEQKTARAGRSPPSPEGRRIDRSSEEQLQSKLDLPRRAEVPGWESSRLNLSKGRAGGRQNRIPEIGMVEHIEHLAPELEGESLGNLCVLCDREIRVQE